ncbi:peptidoglycan DD-metalloendopeptidase family protein [Parablautia muri]|uniref:M23 family metallopeptidase n=1 Tax=Parablautia muri TaxID=2320879 RepID=A0A9X5GTJ6_9FIRM|nr:M23 family metallopeptidase [Parablautia muri]NBJ93072.1 M23 family metallopeptidase [Parablautia muri]
MKQQRHKRRESFSVLLISNVDRSSKQFNISLTFIRLIFFLILLILAVIGLLTFLFLSGNKELSALRAQLDSQAKLVVQLNTEKDTLDNEIQALRAENNDLRQVSKIITTKREEAAAQEAPASNPLPTLFPSSGSGILIETYSEDRPYLSINTHSEGKIVATGDGTVVTVGSDDTYPLILEIEHENGYMTRYMCGQDVQVQTEEGAQVLAGDLLCTVTTDDTQLDYQIFLNGDAIDPLSIIDAKG